MNKILMLLASLVATSFATNTLNFDGTDDYVQTGGPISSTFTVEAWVYPTATNDRPVVSTLTTSANTGMELHLREDSSLFLTVRSNNGTFIDFKTAARLVIPNTWTHVAATFNGTVAALYINGVSCSVTGSMSGSFVAGMAPLRIGNRASGETKYAGNISEVQIWDVVRTQAEIQIDTGSYAAAQTNQRAYYKLDQGAAGGSNTGITTATDLVNSANNGTLTNFALTGTTSNWITGRTMHPVSPISPVSGVAPSGTGASGNPYQIDSLPNLLWLSTNNAVWSAGNEFRLMKDIDASDTKNWNGGKGFAPIGGTGGSTSFSGTFHGAGHVISGLTINRPNEDAVGVFGWFSGLVDSLGLVGGAVSGHNSVGGLVGVNSGTISTSYATGSVNGTDCVGGLVGYVNNSTINTSYATGSVTGSAQVGGLVGRLNGGTISTSYATGSVIGSSYVGGLVGYVNSGIVSTSYWDTITTGMGTSKGCGAGACTGVTGLSTADMKTQSKLTNFSFTDASAWAIYNGRTYPLLRAFLKPLTIVAKDTTKVYDGKAFTGGAAVYTPSNYTASLVLGSMGGTAQGSSDTGTYTIVPDSLYSTQQGYWITSTQGKLHVVAEGVAPAGTGTEQDPYQIDSLLNLRWLSNYDRVWGAGTCFRLTHDIDASDTKNWNGGKGFAPIGNPTTSFSGTFHGAGHVISGLTIKRPSENMVGLFGRLSESSVDSLGLFGGSVSGLNYVGSLVGDMGASTISTSYATGSVTGAYVGGLVGFNGGNIITSYATGSVTGAIDVGGLVGDNFGGIIKSYATGSVTGDNYVGGLVGHTVGPISASYWDTLSSGRGTSQGCGAGTCTGATGLSTADMKTPSKLTNLAFTDTSAWAIYEGHTYPLLRAFLKPLNIAAKDTTKVYDRNAFTGGGVNYSLAEVDTSKIRGTLTFTGSSQGAIDTGHYSLVAAGGLYSSQLGYLISYSSTPATLSIGPKALTIAGAYAANKTYDGTATATVTGATLAGKVNGDNAALSLGTATFATKDVGTAKPVTVTGSTLTGNEAGNYTLTEVSGLTANITPYPIIVTAAAKSIQQGDDNVALTYTADALLGTDAWTGAISRETGDTAGTYVILQGSLSAGNNYEISFHSANYAITEKPVMIDPIVPQLAFTGRANARIYNLQGKLVWSGMLDVNDGHVAMPNIGAGRWVVKIIQP